MVQQRTDLQQSLQKLGKVWLAIRLSTWALELEGSMALELEGSMEGEWGLVMAVELGSLMVEMLDYEWELPTALELAG